MPPPTGPSGATRARISAPTTTRGKSAAPSTTSRRSERVPTAPSSVAVSPRPAAEPESTTTRTGRVGGSRTSTTRSPAPSGPSGSSGTRIGSTPGTRTCATWGRRRSASRGSRMSIVRQTTPAVGRGSRLSSHGMVATPSPPVRASPPTGTPRACASWTPTSAAGCPLASTTRTTTMRGVGSSPSAWTSRASRRSAALIGTPPGRAAGSARPASPARARRARANAASDGDAAPRTG